METFPVRPTEIGPFGEIYQINLLPTSLANVCYPQTTIRIQVKSPRVSHPIVKNKGVATLVLHHRGDRVVLIGEVVNAAKRI